MDDKTKNTEIKGRILEICTDLGLSANKLSLDAGKSREYVRQIKDFVSADFLRYIYRTYPQYSLDWIITGEGSKIRNSDDKNIQMLLDIIHEQRTKIKNLEEEIHILQDVIRSAKE